MSIDTERVEAKILRQRLQEAEETLVAIRRGEVDALVITGPKGEQVFTLKGADHPYRVLVEHMNEGAVTLSADRTILYSNGQFAEIVKSPLEEVIGRSIEDFVTSKDALLALIENSCRGRAEMTLRAGDGSEVPVAMSCAAVQIDESPCLCVVVSDLTEQKHQEALMAEEQRRAEERLRESQRLAAVGKTAAVLAHEIGNPLNGMFTTVQLIERHLVRSKNPSDHAHLNEQLQDLKGEISRLGSLLHEFRSLSGPMQLNLIPMKLGVFVPELLQMTSHICDGCGVEILHDIPNDLPVISADKEKLKQVFLNLCKNAVEAMPSGGKLTLKAYRKDQSVVVEVSDTGMGITEGLDIFEPFTTTKNKGTGLGLAVVRQIVSDHGGRITYASEAGKGTTFYVSLPIA
ncbi:MAG: two-component system sensor histidine kinase NtrB, partial [Candidatus Binatia bacterium]